jgi:hypothetical protein
VAACQGCREGVRRCQTCFPPGLQPLEVLGRGRALLLASVLSVA